MMEARAAVHAFIPKIEIDPDRKVGTLYLPRDTCSALQFSVCQTGYERILEPLVDGASAERFASPRPVEQRGLVGADDPDDVRHVLGHLGERPSPPSYVALPVNAMVISLQARACVRLET
jgi:hypothetical protein